MLDIGKVERWLNSQDLKFNQGEYDALASFFFNLGVNTNILRTFDESTFEKYVYSRGKRLKGLERRRVAERKLYNSIYCHETGIYFNELDETDVYRQIKSKEYTRECKRGVEKLTAMETRLFKQKDKQI